LSAILVDVSGDRLLYTEPQRYSAVVTDRWGRFETTLVNDGQSFELVVRGHRFQGATLDGLELVGPPADTSEPPDLNRGDLCSCTIEWIMPVRIAVSGAEPDEMALHARLTLGDPAPNGAIDHVGVVLALHLRGGVIETTRPHGLMEDALLDLLHRLPADARLVSCICCAFSDYHPVGSGFIGTLACFRDAKDAYRTVNSKRDLFQVWPQLSGFVQETFWCPQFEQRQSGAGYRGWPSELSSPSGREQDPLAQ
jgi:Family of unknown function (DUF6304)